MKSNWNTGGKPEMKLWDETKTSWQGNTALPFREDRWAISLTAATSISAGGFGPTRAGPRLSAGPLLTNQPCVFSQGQCMRRCSCVSLRSNVNSTVWIFWAKIRSEDSDEAEWDHGRRCLYCPRKICLNWVVQHLQVILCFNCVAPMLLELM